MKFIFYTLLCPWGSFWRAGGDVLFFATAPGPLLGGILASLLLLNLQPCASKFGLSVGSSERLQGLTEGTADSVLLRFVRFTLGDCPELLDLVDLELLQGLNRWRGRKRRGGRLCWRWVLGQPLADLCIAELSRPLVGGKILKKESNRISNIKNTPALQISPRHTRSVVVFEDSSSGERLLVDEVVWDSAGEEPVGEESVGVDEVMTLCGSRHLDSSAILGSDTLKWRISHFSIFSIIILCHSFELSPPWGWWCHWSRLSFRCHKTRFHASFWGLCVWGLIKLK